MYSTPAQEEMASEGCEKLGVGANQCDIAIRVEAMTSCHVTGKSFYDFIHAVKPGILALLYSPRTS